MKDKDNKKDNKDVKNMLEVFTNEKFGEIRTMMIDGKVYFCGSDVARALEYTRPNDAVNQHCKRGILRNTVHPQNSEKTIEMKFIPESDVYRLLAKSNLPKAEEFESWIFEEVLPSINKHGAYMTDMTIEKLADNPDLVIQLAKKLKEERKKRSNLENLNKQQNQIIAELGPKASYYDLVLQCPDLIPITQIAKDYGVSGKWFNNKLHELGIQYKFRDTWLLYAKYAKKGYTKSKTICYDDNKINPRFKLHTYWNQKGRLFLYHTLKNHNILPLIEKEDS